MSVSRSFNWKRAVFGRLFKVVQYKADFIYFMMMNDQQSHKYPNYVCIENIIYVFSISRMHWGYRNWSHLNSTSVPTHTICHSPTKRMAPKCLRMFQHKPVVVRADLLCRMRKHSPATVDGVSGGYLLETRHPKFGWVRLSHYIEIPAIIICDFPPSSTCYSAREVLHSWAD